MKRERAALAAELALLAVLLVFAPRFFASPNLRDLLIGMAPVLVAATGMTLVITAGEIDISIGSQFAVTSVAAGLFAAAGFPMPAVALLTFGTGAALGLVNAALIAWLGVPSIVATLATMAGLREALRWATGGAWVQGLPRGFQWFGLGQNAGQWMIISCAVLVWALLTWAARNVAAFRAIYATGSDAEAARLSGISVRSVRAGVFLLMGGLTALAALLNAVRFTDVQSNAGSGLELKAIAACVVGGASVSGGRGTLWGTLLGVLLLTSIGPALTFLGINPFWEKAIQGGIILAAVFADTLANRTIPLVHAH